MNKRILQEIGRLDPHPSFNMGTWSKPMEAILDTVPDADPEERQRLMFMVRFARLATAMAAENLTTKADVDEITTTLYEYIGENRMLDDFQCSTRAYTARELLKLTKRLAKAKK